MANTHYSARLEPVTAVLQGAAPATAANYGIFFTAYQACQIVSVRMRFETAGSSSTVDVVKVPSGTAKASGTTVLTAAMKSDGTGGAADTNISGTLSATVTALQLAVGDSLALKNGGTLTSSAGVTVTVNVRPYGPVAA